MTNISYGSKYDKNRTTTEEAKLFHADVKTAIKTGALPKGLKLSVKTDYFSGGSAIRVKIVAVPAGFVILDPTERTRYSTEATTLKRKLESMLNEYNFDGSDTMTDYFHVNFYGSVDFCSELEAIDSKAMEVANAHAHADVIAVATDALLDGNVSAAAKVIKTIEPALELADWRGRPWFDGATIAKQLLARLARKATEMQAVNAAA